MSLPKFLLKREEIMENKEKVLAKMQSEAKPLRPGEIADLTGIDKKDISKYIKELKTEEKVYSPKRCFYQAKW